MIKKIKIKFNKVINCNVFVPHYKIRKIKNTEDYSI